MNVTVIPQQKVRYSYSTPSMSRRGGVRLHPVKDGVVPMGEQLCYLRKRDKAGQRLIDVVDPDSGYCVGVRSNLESAPNNEVGYAVKPGINGSHNAETRRGASVYIPEHGVYTDEEGFVIRTCDMGDAPRPRAYVTPPRETVKERPVRKPRASRTQPGDTVPGATGVNGRITEADCVALIRAMAKGKRNFVITKVMIFNAKQILIKKRNEAAKILAKKQGK